MGEISDSLKLSPRFNVQLFTIILQTLVLYYKVYIRWAMIPNGHTHSHGFKHAARAQVPLQIWLGLNQGAGIEDSRWDLGNVGYIGNAIFLDGVTVLRG
jgi:hypothetical protein